VTAVAASLRCIAILTLGLTAAACAGPNTSDGTSRAALPPAGAIGERAAPLPDMRPEQLLGLSAEQLTDLLGPADFARSDGPAEIWQFRDPDCVLDVFLYMDPQRGAYGVEHVEGRDHDVVRAADQRCVAALLRARRGRSATG
jgi:hypothetical protein